MSNASNLPAEVRVHHPYSPSKLQSLESCPKYVSREEEEVSAASAAGTRQHDAVENERDDNLLKDHEAIAVAECIQFVEMIHKKYPGGTVLKEQYLETDDYTVLAPDGTPFKGTTAGYLDDAIVSADGTEADITDFKFGKWAVEPTQNNLQGIAYMLGILKKFPKLKRCTVRFLMPHRDEVDVHTFELTDENVAKFHVRIRTVVGRAIEAAKNPDDFSSARPNVGACLFCALVGRCPKITEIALNIGKKYAPLEIPDEVSPTLLGTPAGVSIGIKVAQVVTEWAKGFRAQATDKSLRDDSFIPDGYRLVSMKRRTVEDAMKMTAVAKKMLPEDKHAAVDALLDIPIGKLEELIELVTPRGQKKHAVAEFGEKLLAEGAVKEGRPFAILKQKTTND